MRLPLTVRWTIGAAVGETAPSPRREFPRGLLLPCQGRQGRFCRGNPSDAPERNYPGRPCSRSVASAGCSAPNRATTPPWASWPRSSATNFCAGRRKLTLFAAFFQVKILGLKVETVSRSDFRKWFGKSSFSRSSCSLTAEAGRISRGALAPQRSARLLFFRAVFSQFLPNFWGRASLYSSHLLYFRAGDFLSPSAIITLLRLSPRRPRLPKFS